MGASLFRALAGRGDIDPLTGQTRVDPAAGFTPMQPVNNIGQGIAQAGSALVNALLTKSRIKDQDAARKTAAEKLALALVPPTVDTTSAPVSSTGAMGEPLEGAQADGTRASRQALVDALLGSPEMAGAAKQISGFQALPANLRDMPSIKKMFGMDDPESFEVISGEQAQALGLPPGAVAQRNRRTGQINVIQKPDTPATAQEYEFAKQNGGFNGSYQDFLSFKGKVGAAGSELPSAVREFQFFQSLPPEQQQRFLTMKRANPYLNLGDVFAQPDQLNPGKATGALPVGIAPERKVDDGQVITLPAVPGAAVAPPQGVVPPAAAPAPAVGAAGSPNQPVPAPVPPPATAPTVQVLPPTPDEIAKASAVAADAERSIKLVDDLINHPGMKDVVGKPDSFAGAVAGVTGMAIPGTDAAGFMARAKQIEGKQFLQAFESLKGGGAITQIEGEKASAAMSRLMQFGQKEEEYIAAANELKDILRAGMERAKAKAARGQAPTPPGWSIQRVQ